MNKKYSIVSLFSGCGGLDLGFHEQDYKILMANDHINDFCVTFFNNLKTEAVCQDINNIDLKSIPRADIVIGGPPCQSFSLVGKRDSSDKRGGLVWSYLNVIKHVKPKIFLLENVPGLRSAKNFEGHLVLDDLKEEFEKNGYKINVYLLNSADYGVPQRRKRLFVIGNRLGLNIEPPVATHSENGDNNLKKWVTAEDALSDLPKPSIKDNVKYKTIPKNDFQRKMRKNSKGVFNHYPTYASDKDLEIIKAVKPGGNYNDVPDSIATKRILNFKKTGGRTTTYGRLHKNKTPYTINTNFNRPNVGCNIHYNDDRLITIREALRIQSFPDDFIIYSSNKKNYYTQVGNAVPPLLAEAWAKQIKKYLK